MTLEGPSLKPRLLGQGIFINHSLFVKRMNFSHKFFPPRWILGIIPRNLIGKISWNLSFE